MSFGFDVWHFVISGVVLVAVIIVWFAANALFGSNGGTVDRRPVRS